MKQKKWDAVAVRAAEVEAEKQESEKPAEPGERRETVEGEAMADEEEEAVQAPLPEEAPAAAPGAAPKKEEAPREPRREEPKKDEPKKPEPEARRVVEKQGDSRSVPRR